MVATLRLPGRLILVVGFALATAIAPTVAVLADIGSPGAYVITADPTQTCTVVKSNGSNSLVCKPNSITPNGLLPSEQDLTLQNETRQGGPR
jgi:hypothetical protein